MNQEPYFTSRPLYLTEGEVWNFQIEMQAIERAQSAISAISDIGAFLARNKDMELLNDIENNHLTNRGLHDAIHTASLIILFSHESILTTFERALEKAEKEDLL